MFFSKKCEHCKARIVKDEGLQEKVEVYGLVGLHKRSFCSEKCLESHRKVTPVKKKMGKSVCTSCMR